MGTKTLRAAKAAKNDEFYTRLTDIEKEMMHYKRHFKGKVVYCNCDDPRRSKFVEYLLKSFNHLGLRRLLVSGIDANGEGQMLICDIEPDPTSLDQYIDANTVEIEDGRFQSDTGKELLSICDIVVTNPPFSVFREYVDLMIESGKRFLVIGSLMAAVYKEIYPLIQANKIWLGVSSPQRYVKPDGSEQKFGNIKWYTNLPHQKRVDGIPLYAKYNPTDNPKYDNCDAIEVGKTAEIPVDYDGVMGVPISFLEKHDPTQFELLQRAEETNPLVHSKASNGCWSDLSIGSRLFPKRVLIQRKGA